MNTDYLKWDAESIQELLRRKLTESGLLTDQLYPGSDTSIIIDLFAWTYDVLTYILNNSSIGAFSKGRTGISKVAPMGMFLLTSVLAACSSATLTPYRLLMA